VRYIPPQLLGLAVAGLLLLTHSRELANTDHLPFDRWFAYIGISLAVLAGAFVPRILFRRESRRIA